MTAARAWEWHDRIHTVQDVQGFLACMVVAEGLGAGFHPEASAEDYETGQGHVFNVGQSEAIDECLDDCFDVCEAAGADMFVLAAMVWHACGVALPPGPDEQGNLLLESENSSDGLELLDLDDLMPDGLTPYMMATVHEPATCGGGGLARRPTRQACWKLHQWAAWQLVAVGHRGPYDPDNVRVHGDPMGMVDGEPRTW